MLPDPDPYDVCGTINVIKANQTVPLAAGHTTTNGTSNENFIGKMAKLAIYHQVFVGRGVGRKGGDAGHRAGDQGQPPPTRPSGNRWRRSHWRKVAPFSHQMGHQRDGDASQVSVAISAFPDRQDSHQPATNLQNGAFFLICVVVIGGAVERSTESPLKKCIAPYSVMKKRHLLGKNVKKRLFSKKNHFGCPGVPTCGIPV